MACGHLNHQLDAPSPHSLRGKLPGEICDRNPPLSSEWGHMINAGARDEASVMSWETVGLFCEANLVLKLKKELS